VPQVLQELLASSCCCTAAAGVWGHQGVQLAQGWLKVEVMEA
jgi:hypothetical protein